MSTARIDGVDLRFDDEGSGPALVLVHGHPFNRSMWQPQAQALSRLGWRVVAPDLRGFGQSTMAPGATGDSSSTVTTLESFAGDIAGLLDHLGIRQVVLCGLSMGGQVALEFHRLYPRRLRGLILADTSAVAESQQGRLARRRMAARLVAEGMAGYAREVLPRMLAPGSIQDLPAVAEHVLEMMRDTPVQGAAAALRGRAERLDYVGMLPRIAVPTLVVVGREDEFTPVSDARLLYELIPGAELVVIDGAGHLPNMERPDEFNDAIHRFLVRNPATRAGRIDVPRHRPPVAAE